MRKAVKTERLAAAKRRAIKPQAKQGVHAERDRATRPVALVIDNYDSFTYNLAQCVGSLGWHADVFLNDCTSPEHIKSISPDAVIISPGPGKPSDSGCSVDVAAQLAGSYPLLGVCMGHQCIASAFGGAVIKAPMGLVHGKGSSVEHVGSGVFAGLHNPLHAARYHSLVVSSDGFPHQMLHITAWDAQHGTIMGLRHSEYHDVVGVQFHPESIITEDGPHVVSNFLSMAVNDKHTH